MKLIYLLSTILLAINVQGQTTGFDFYNTTHLIGTWKSDNPRFTSYERWSRLNDSSLIGKSFRLRGNDTIITEEIKLVKTEKGIYYIPTALGQNNDKPVAFKLIDVTNSVWIFENAEHDFPQRICYELKDETLHAWIEGKMNGNFRKIDFNFVKVQ